MQAMPGVEQAGAGDEIEAEALVMRHRGARGRGTLAADHLRLPAPDVVNDERRVATGAVQVRLHDL